VGHPVCISKDLLDVGHPVSISKNLLEVGHPVCISKDLLDVGVRSVCVFSHSQSVHNKIQW